MHGNHTHIHTMRGVVCVCVSVGGFSLTFNLCKLKLGIRNMPNRSKSVVEKLPFITLTQTHTHTNHAHMSCVTITANLNKIGIPFFFFPAFILFSLSFVTKCTSRPSNITQTNEKQSLQVWRRTKLCTECSTLRSVSGHTLTSESCSEKYPTPFCLVSCCTWWKIT